MKKIKKLPIFFIVFLLIIVVTILLLYICQENFRNWIDLNILRKDITEEDIIAIDLDTGKSNQVYVYNKYIAILNNQVMKLYNNYGEEINSISVSINKALFDSNDKYLAIAEDGGGEIYLILDKTYLWSNKTEGEILQVHVNRNGYVAIITKDSTYKSIITVYNSDGTQLFRSYFSDTRIIDISISNDNKYIAIGEIDSTGALIKSNVKILSIEAAKKGKEDAIFYTHNAEDGKLLTNVEFQAKGQITCMYDNSIDIIYEEQNKQILNIEDKKIAFMSVDLTNHVIYIEEEKNGVFNTNSHINIINTQDNKVHTYNLEEVIKGLYSNYNIIAVNVGTEIYFLNTNGWLIRKYSTKQEITNVIFSKYLAGVIYKDKIVIINL